MSGSVNRTLSIRIQPETVRTIDASTLSGTYMGVGSALDRPIRIIILQNYSDQPVMFSFDGINDHLPLASNGYVVLDITANKTHDVGFFLAQGERLYVKEIDVTPTTGNIYFSTFYGDY